MDINIGITEPERQKIAEGLSKLLADSYTLYLQTHNFHWNVTGPLFHVLHEVFEKQYQEIWEAVDEIAERIRALGFQAPGTYSQFNKLASIKETDEVPEAMDMVKLLVQGNEAVVNTARQIFPVVDKNNDEPSADLLTRRMQKHEEAAWMLRSMLDKQ